MVSGYFAIRTADSSDLSGICKVERTSFAHDAYPSFLLEKLILDSQAIFFVLTGQLGEIIGYCVSKDLGTCSHLISVAVLPKHRRSGAASRMLKELFTLLGKRGIHKVRLEVRTDNVSAIKLYRRFGFIEEVLIQDYYSDGSAALRMRKIIQ